MEKRDKCRICRKAGEKLFLKGDKCLSPACPLNKKNYPPGHLGAKRRMGRSSDYAAQLKEKQKVRSIYGIPERQMANYFKLARRTRRATASQLVSYLERRLDNVFFRAGWAQSRSQSRQYVSHGKVKVNDRTIKSPSYQLKIDDKVSVQEVGKLPKTHGEAPAWLKVEKTKGQIEIKALPTLDDASGAFNIQQVIEYYSR